MMMERFKEDLTIAEFLQIIHDSLSKDDFYMCNNISRYLCIGKIGVRLHYETSQLLRANKPFREGSDPRFDKYYHTTGFVKHESHEHQSWWSFFPDRSEKNKKDFISMDDYADKVVEIKKEYLRDLIELAKELEDGKI